MDIDQMTLTTAVHGMAPELFEQKLAEVIENFNDPQCEKDASRTITLTFTIAPLKKLNGFSVSLSAKAGLKLRSYTEIVREKDLDEQLQIPIPFEIHTGSASQ